MGQIAEDMIDGTCCYWCGMYFEDPEGGDMLPSHGYPVVCKDCFKDWRKEHKQGKGSFQRKYGLEVSDFNTM